VLRGIALAELVIPHPLRRHAPGRSGWRSWWPLAAEAAAVCGIVGLAVLLRLPTLMVVPRLTDETFEVLLGLRIARGEALALVGVNTYIGALFNYLVAGAFQLLGPRPEAGRLTALLFGVLGIVPTYLLGRRLGGPGWRGPATGLIGAVLLACSSTDILVTSRIAYSNSLTPFFTTAGLWLLHRAVRCRSGRSLALSGALFGLALQAHASALAIWPGLAGYLLLHRRDVRWRWVVLAGLLGLAMVANVVAYNVINPGATVDEMLFRSARYGGLASGGMQAWPWRLELLLRSLTLALGGRASELVEPIEAFVSPPVLAFNALAVVGLILLARRREWLPLCVVLSELLVVSLLNNRVEPVVVRARHFAQLLPLGFVLVAVAVLAVRDRLARLGPRLVADGAAVLLVGLLALGQQLQLQAYVSERLAHPDKNNRALLQVADAISRGSPTERVYLDAQLVPLRTMSGGRMYTQIRYLLLVRGQEYEQFDLASQTLPVGRPGVESRRVVLSAASVEAAAARYRLVPLRGDPGDGSPIRVFRAFPRPSG
jgi:hypothetical protein